MMLGLQYDFTSSRGSTHKVMFKSVEAINDVLRLYYETRCISSHGFPGKTLSEVAMQNFPQKQQLAQGMCCPTAASDLMRFYEELKRNYGYVFGWTCVCSTVFFFVLFCFFHLANRLMVAVAFQVREVSQNRTVCGIFLRGVVITSASPTSSGDDKLDMYW